jgi:hypothetical protein
MSASVDDMPPNSRPRRFSLTTVPDMFYKPGHSITFIDLRKSSFKVTELIEGLAQ